MFSEIFSKAISRTALSHFLIRPIESAPHASFPMETGAFRALVENRIPQSQALSLVKVVPELGHDGAVSFQ